MNLVSKVCKSFHVDCGALEMPYAKTDAYAALEASRRALTIAGVDGTRLACARTEDDLPQCQPDETSPRIRGRDRGYPPFVDGVLRSQRVFVY